MMTIALATISLILLFLVLGKGANILIDNLQVIAQKTKTNPIIIGAILGFFTTIPEFSVGLNAIRNDIGEISLGNVWGGIIVLFTLVLGTAIVFNQTIKTDGKLYFVLPSFFFVLLAIFLAYRGQLNWRDGIIILGFYFLLIYIKFIRGIPRSSKDINPLDIEAPPNFWQRLKNKIFIWHRDFKKEISLSFAGLLVILVSSHFIVELSAFLLKYWDVSPFIVGLLLFSIGTNLPELTITIRSAFKRAGELSFGHLVGAATNSTAILGLLALFHTFTINVNWSFIVLSLVMTVVLSIVTLFYMTRKSFDRWEGFVLLGIYVLFITYQILAV